MLRTTVIAKTDIVRSTELLRGMSADSLQMLLVTHKGLISAIVARHQGVIIKGEGDAFWLTFPSVTAAALAAVDMQRELRSSQIGRPDSERLAMRISIALGDLLHQDNDVFGVAMSLAARLDSMTPADEIYLCHAAWLALNHAQVKTVFVEAVALKGFDHPEHVYRVVQEEDVAVERNQVVVAVDMGRFNAFVSSHNRHNIAHILTQYEATTLVSSTINGGKLRTLAGDLHLITFESPVSALKAVDMLTGAWRAVVATVDAILPLRIGIHQGDCYQFRTYLFGETINRSFLMARIGAELSPDGGNDITIVSGMIAAALRETPFAHRLEPITLERFPRPLAGVLRTTLEREGAYCIQMDQPQPSASGNSAS